LWGGNNEWCTWSLLDNDLLRFLANDDGLGRLWTGIVFDGSGIMLEIATIILIWTTRGG